MALVFANQAGSTLSSPIDNVTTTIPVVNATEFPALTTGQNFYLVIESTDRASFEVCLASAVDTGANTITVTRGVGGTAPQSFDVGSYAENRLTKTTLESLIQSLPESGSGEVINNAIRVTQSEYDALTPDPNTLYLIPGNPAAGGGIAAVQVLTTGTTWTPTNSDYSKIIVQCIGGGGGGGYGYCNEQRDVGVGGGGGAGGYACEVLTAATVGASATYAIGSGGAGSSTRGVAGGAGGTTTFGTGPLLQATGGAGGASKEELMSSLNNFTPTVYAVGGAGGIGSSANINAKGAPGGYGSGTASFDAEYPSAVSGHGGSSHYGGGGESVTTTIDPNTGVAGVGGYAYGSGGSGGASNQSFTGYAGGAGSAGVIVVWEIV